MDDGIGDLAMDWPDSMDAEDRIGNIVNTVREPRSAEWVADRADVTTDTAREYLKQLVARGEFVTVESDETSATLYAPDPEQQTMDRVLGLAENSQQNLQELQKEVEGEIDEIKSRYDAKKPVEIRQTIDPSLSEEERRQRQKDARRWEKNEHFLSLLDVAVAYRRHGDRFS